MSHPTRHHGPVLPLDVLEQIDRSATGSRRRGNWGIVHGSRTTLATSTRRTDPRCSTTCWPRSSAPAAGAASGPSRTSIATGFPARPRRSWRPLPRR